MEIRGCIFDFGGVMTPALLPDLARPLVEGVGAKWGDVVAGYARHRRLMDGDIITMEEMYERIWREIGAEVSADALARIVAADRASFLARDEETLAFMRSLRARGFAIGILTNMPTSFAPLFRERFADYIALADAVVVSGEERLYKPMPEIYALMQRRIGMEPGSLCFFDDVEANCAAARAAGWRAVRFESAAQCARDFGAILGADGATA